MRKTSIKNRLVRYRQIGNILAKYGFGIFLEKIRLSRILKIPLEKKRKKEILSMPERLRLMCEELGPTFVKLGQILSTRPDLIPLSFIKEFEKLQDEVTPLKTEVIKNVIYEELGLHTVDELFSSFEEEPLASASISQVHRAVLKNGEEVVLKVQKPGIEKIINADISILYDITSLIERHIEESEIYQPRRIVEEFEKIVKKELNFLQEARNIGRFSKNFSSDETVYVTKIYKDLTTEKILTLEYVEGVKIDEVEELEKMGLDRKEIALNGARSILKQIFVDGFFHADPHPGNILVLENGKICYLDFGIVGRLDEERKTELVSLFEGFLNKDAERIVNTLILMEAIEESVDLKGLRREIGEIMDEYYDVSLKEIKIKEIIDEEFEIMRKFKIKIPSGLSLLTKALITTEGVGIILDPDFNISYQIKPFVADLMKERLGLFSLVKDFKKTFLKFCFLMKEFPKDLETFLRNIKKGYLNIAFEHKGLKNLTSTIDKSSNRISFSLIISALIIGSSLIMLSGEGTLFMGFPIPGIFGFIFAAILGLWLIISILRAGKL